MGFGQHGFTCRNCGRRGEVGAAPDRNGNCERCTEVSVVHPSRAGGPRVIPVEESVEDSGRRGALARLRERYAEAREMVSMEPPFSKDHEHLDWILGGNRNPFQDDAALDSGVSELVVLWLEDMVLELDGPDPSRSHSRPVASTIEPAGSRQTVAEGLRTAARDFAEAFLVPLPRAVCGP